MQALADLSHVRPIREWPVTSRPRERLAERGAGSLSESELIAILVGSGTRGKDALALSQSVLLEIGGLRELTRADSGRLRKAGLGPATIAKVLAACELGRRVVAADAQGEVLDSPAAAARALAPHLAHLEREALVVALLSRKNRLITAITVYQGNLSGASVRIAEIFTEAIRRNAAAVLLAHNHPSGDPEPSLDDLRTTAEAVQAGRLLGIAVVDHVIVGAGRSVSLRERGVDFAVSS